MADKILENLNKNSYNDISGQKNTYEEDVAKAQNPNGITEVNPQTGLEETREATAADAKLNTGGGAEAAVGTDYTWNQQGSSQAQKTYSSDVLSAKQNLLTNRQSIENNAVNYQAQADMMKYQNNQNAEKVGWTGGYVLDQNRQMDYLKASIQAQMYGAMELQKYGHDSALAAARLSYDLNQQEYARQYYQEAVSAALSEAQLTGTYFSAETKDMMSQLAVAQQKKNDQSLTEDERNQAAQLEKQIEDWFQSNGISKEGVKTLEAWQQDQANELQWSNELWTRYQAVLETARTEISENASKFIMLDAEGKEYFDGTNVVTGDWDTMTAQSVGDYLLSGENKTLNQQAVNQFYSYLDSTLTGQIESGFSTWCANNGFFKTNEDGSRTLKKNITEADLLNYIDKSGIVQRLEQKYSEGIKDKPEYSELYDIFNNWDFTIQLPDGSQKTYTYKQLTNLEQYKEDNNIGPASASGGSGDLYGGVQIDGSGNVTQTGTPAVVFKDYGKAKLQTSQINGGYDDDFDYDLGEGIGDGTKNYNYDIDVDWVWPGEHQCAANTASDKGFNEANYNKTKSYLTSAYPGADTGDLAFDRSGNLWIYHYTHGWGYVQANTGGSRLSSDLKTYLKGGITPDRWK